MVGSSIIVMDGSIIIVTKISPIRQHFEFQYSFEHWFKMVIEINLIPFDSLEELIFIIIKVHFSYLLKYKVRQNFVDDQTMVSSSFLYHMMLKYL